MSEPALFEVPRQSLSRDLDVVVDPDLPIDAAVASAFWSRVIKSSSCWYWTGAISSPDGYGRINWRRRGRQRTLSAQRFAMLLMIPELADGQVCEHHCNQPLCVRVDPEHLLVGTQASNLAYAAAIGRAQGPRVTALHTRVGRSLAIRDYLVRGGDSDQIGSVDLEAAVDQLPLWSL